MLKRVFKLFQIARRLSTSGAVDIINQVHQIPVPINLFFSLISVGTENNRFENNKKLFPSFHVHDIVFSP